MALIAFVVCFVWPKLWLTLRLAGAVYNLTIPFPWSQAIGINLYEFLGLVVDLFFIVFFRWVLRRIAATKNTWAIVCFLVIIIGVAAFLITPAVVLTTVGFAFRRHSNDSVAITGAQWVTWWPFYIVGWVSITNAIDVVCLLLLASILTLLVIHRLLWPFIKRPLYAANRKGLIKNTKLLGAFGTMLLLYAFPNNPVVKWLTEFLPRWRSG